MSKTTPDNNGIISPLSCYHRDNTLHQRIPVLQFKPIYQIFNENFQSKSITNIQQGLKLYILLDFFPLIFLRNIYIKIGHAVIKYKNYFEMQQMMV